MKDGAMGHPSSLILILSLGLAPRLHSTTTGAAAV